MAFRLRLSKDLPQPGVADGQPHPSLPEAARFADEHEMTVVWLSEQLAVGANDPEFFRRAAQNGTNVLFPLLGRSVESVAKNIALYRRTWRESGRAGNGSVTLVVPTLVGEDNAEIKEAVHQPLKNLLKNDVSLLREAAFEFLTLAATVDERGTTIDHLIANLSNPERDDLLEFAAERCYTTSGLFGTQSRCRAMIDRLKEIGVDEVCCLIDFGLPPLIVLAHLPALNDLRLACEARAADAAPDGEVARPGLPIAASQSPRVDSVQPTTAVRTETQQKLAELWKKLLETEEIDLNDNFFELGGHSLLAVRAISKIEKEFGPRLTVKTLLVSTFGQIAAEIDRFVVNQPAPVDFDTGGEVESTGLGRLSRWFKGPRKS
jgi:acyl carrier protein